MWTVYRDSGVRNVLIEFRDGRGCARRRVAAAAAGGRAFLFAGLFRTGTVVRDGAYEIVETKWLAILCEVDDDRLGGALG